MPRSNRVNGLACGGVPLLSYGAAFRAGDYQACLILRDCRAFQPNAIPPARSLRRPAVGQSGSGF
ncbi:MAG: hypothetical protein NZ585_15005 [Chloracidobacterium sp.]|nr:hypothetical protein [Chloracidobacterium sp.]